MLRILAAVIALSSMVGTAEARCVYGHKTLPGSLGPHQVDNTRSFTVSGWANFRVEVLTGGPITANLGCGWEDGYNISCDVEAYGERSVRLRNNTNRQITYLWICNN